MLPDRNGYFSKVTDYIILDNMPSYTEINCNFFVDFLKMLTESEQDSAEKLSFYFSVKLH